MIKKLLLVAVLIGLLALFFIYGGQEYLNFDSLKLHKNELLSYANANFWQTFFIIGGIYILSTMLNLPGAAIMSLAIGFIFGRWYGTLLAISSATIGAVLVFWIARYLIADWARPRLEKMKSTQNIMAQLQNDAFSYLLFMRAVPLFPFWFVNMVFAFSPIDTRHYAIGTFLGMLPVSFVIVNLGQSLSTVDSMEQLFTTEVILSFVMIGVLALITTTIMRYRKAKITLKKTA
ncbi:MAG: TVP38/TMEM64 family protein [Piscirickettsiaceae bacterium]|nr:TVP38/TMEM64 family protein [Piscirickettsiaceae bacterium]